MQGGFHIGLIDKVTFGEAIGLGSGTYPRDLKTAVVNIFRPVSFDRIGQGTCISPENLETTRAFIVQNNRTRNIHRCFIAVQNDAGNAIAGQKQTRGQTGRPCPNDHNGDLCWIHAHVHSSPKFGEI